MEEKSKNPRGCPILNCAPPLIYIKGNKMIENDGLIDPKVYRTWVAFMHDCCIGCKNEYGSYSGEDERIR